MFTKEQAKKIISLSTYNQLNKQLYALEYTIKAREKIKIKEKLRDFIGKLFTYGDIFEFHDDHILDLAETIAGLYPEREDLKDYIYHILIYLENQIGRYEKVCQQKKQELVKKEIEKLTDPDGYLDKEYEVWTYTDGYYRQRTNMYRLLRQTLKDLLYYEERGVLCKRKRASAKK